MGGEEKFGYIFLRGKLGKGGHQEVPEKEGSLS